MENSMENIHTDVRVSRVKEEACPTNHIILYNKLSYACILICSSLMIYWRTDVEMMSSLKLFSILYYTKQIDSKLQCICSVIDHRWHPNVVRTSVTHLATPRVPLFVLTTF